MRKDGTYTRLVMWLQNLSWRNHPMKAEVYGDIPPTVAWRLASFVGHCFKCLLTTDVILWRPPCPTKGRHPLTYPDTISRDIGLSLEDLTGAIEDKPGWHIRVSLTAVDG